MIRFRRSRRGRLAAAFIPLHFEIPEAIERVEANETTMHADKRGDGDRSGTVRGAEHQIAICLDGRPFIVTADGALTKRIATREEVLELPFIHGAEPMTRGVGAP